MREISSVLSHRQSLCDDPPLSKLEWGPPYWTARYNLYHVALKMAPFPISWSVRGLRLGLLTRRRVGLCRQCCKSCSCARERADHAIPCLYRCANRRAPSALRPRKRRSALGQCGRPPATAPTAGARAPFPRLFPSVARARARPRARKVRGAAWRVATGAARGFD